MAVEQAQAKIIKESNDLERHKAELEAKARSEEERTIAAGRQARAVADQELQEIRSDLETLRLQADTVIPADKQRAAQELRAAGDAALRAETGRAQAQALDALMSAWRDAGDDANEVFLIQQIDRILADVAAVTKRLSIEHVNLIDGGDGRTLARHVGSYPAVVAEIFERIKETVGIDVVAMLTKSNNPPKTTPPAPAVAARTGALMGPTLLIIAVVVLVALLAIGLSIKACSSSASPRRS